MDSFTGQILPIAFTYAPRATAFCQGQLLPINQNQALYSLLGTAFGGNGTSNFGLPNTGGRTITGGVGAGAAMGASGGEANHALVAAEIPPHSHPLNAITGTTGIASASGAMPATAAAPVYGAANNLVGLAVPLSQVGGGQAHPNMQPSSAINYVIVLAGFFPPRS